MILKVFNSNSSGNGYALTDNKGSTLILECGVPLIEIKKYLGFQIEGIVGCLVSHSHGDHIKYINQYLAAGIHVSMSIETATAMGVEKHHRVKIIEAGRKYSSLLDEFVVLPVEMKHDVHCLAFIIKHEEMGNTVFITDSYFSPVKFANINNWLIECNYSSEIIDQNTTNTFVRNRVLQSHLSLENCIDIFKVNDMTKTNSVVLLHLSDTNSDAIGFRKNVMEVTGKTVHVAEPGLEINLDRTPF